MKITKSRLKQIIKEEFEATLDEQGMSYIDVKTGRSVDDPRQKQRDDFKSLIAMTSNNIANALQGLGVEGDENNLHKYIKQIMAGSEAPPRGADTENVDPGIFTAVAEAVRELASKFQPNYAKTQFPRMLAQKIADNINRRNRR